MPFHQPPIYSSALEQAIDRHPLIVTPETSLLEAIALISQLQNKCSLPEANLAKDIINVSESSLWQQVRARCILVVKNKPSLHTNLSINNHRRSSLLGILTEGDIVRLIATGKINNHTEISLHKLPVSEVMSPPSITLTESTNQDIFTALSLFRQHQIDYLPVVDRHAYLVGVLTRERIRQVLQPSNIFKLRRVSELMTTPISAPQDASLLSIAQLMSEHQVSCVVITQNKELKMEKPREARTSICYYSFQQPLGMIAEYDIVQAQFLELNLANYTASMVMRNSLFSLKPSDSLWVAHQEMQQQQIQRLVVCGSRGEMLGLITQTSLLQVLDPTEMYRAVKQLQKSVYQLQAEKLELLKSRNAKLEEEVRERTAKLHEQLERDRLLTKISLRIHQSLNLDEIINATVAEVQQILQADRCTILRLESTDVGIIVAESVAPGWPSTLGNIVPKTIWEQCSQAFVQEHYAVYNIDQVNLTPEKITQFKQAEIKAFIAVPILQDSQLWGMMCVHQCHNPREWQKSEVDLLLQLATQVAIAIQQAQLYQQVQNLNSDLELQVQERTAQLQQKIQELQQLNVLKDDFLSTVSHELRTPLANMKMAIHMLKISPTIERRQIYLGILEAECARETDLINALLDLQRLESSTSSINWESVNLQCWLPTIIESFKSRAQNRHQVFKIDCDLNLPTIISNRASLARILAELLNNACKYTPNGGEFTLKIHYNREDENKPEKIIKKGVGNHSHRNRETNFSPIPNSHSASSSYKVKFIVSNQAEIPKEELPHIFEKFYRVPNADPWKQGGTGLGLALVQKLVEQLGGEIQVVSGDGWTTFTVQLTVNCSQ
ncbi:histidine kinase [Oscillatoriales cyanobacterium USR001]|nr:histidine kinase [Oscillatoriales cyanobacterium USR001]